MHTVLLRSPESFAALWLEITALRAILEVEDAVLLDPLHVLALSSNVRRSCSVACWDDARFAGIFFALEHYSKGLRTGYAVAGDYSGRGLLLCRPEDESTVVETAAARIFGSGVHSLEIRHTPRANVRWRFAGLRTRQFEATIPGDRMPLPPTYEEFLQFLGGHTRKHARYYRRKVLELGMTFDACVEDDEFRRERVRLNHTTRFPLSRLHLERDDRLLLLHDAHCKFGLRDAAGVLVALVCGFIKGGQFHLLTQWNDPAYEKLSLSLVLRGFVIELLIEKQCSGIYFMGGTTLFSAAFVIRNLSGWPCSSAIAESLPGRRSCWRSTPCGERPLDAHSLRVSRG